MSKSARPQQHAWRYQSLEEIKLTMPRCREKVTRGNTVMHDFNFVLVKGKLVSTHDRISDMRCNFQYKRDQLHRVICNGAITTISWNNGRIVATKEATHAPYPRHILRTRIRRLGPGRTELSLTRDSDASIRYEVVTKRDTRGRPTHITKRPPKQSYRLTYRNNQLVRLDAPGYSRHYDYSCLPPPIRTSQRAQAAQ